MIFTGVAIAALFIGDFIMAFLVFWIAGFFGFLAIIQLDQIACVLDCRMIDAHHWSKIPAREFFRKRSRVRSWRDVVALTIVTIVALIIVAVLCG